MSLRDRVAAWIGRRIMARRTGMGLAQIDEFFEQVGAIDREAARLLRQQFAAERPQHPKEDA
jgi:hypothetical protein